uniref:Uncharacterized protein n=1 Tax=Piliocolobus tephrosceles TaxID=591936 RepID=A0A8C9LNF8_9PRIM
PGSLSWLSPSQGTPWGLTPSNSSEPPLYGSGLLDSAFSLGTSFRKTLRIDLTQSQRPPHRSLSLHSGKGLVLGNWPMLLISSYTPRLTLAYTVQLEMLLQVPEMQSDQV